MALTSGRCSSTTRSRRARRAVCWAAPFCFTWSTTGATGVTTAVMAERSVALDATGFTGTRRAGVFDFGFAVEREAGIARTAIRGGAAADFTFIVAIIFKPLLPLLISFGGG